MSRQKQSKSEWKLVKNSWISAEPVLPGVWRRKEGGCVVRGRTVDPTTGKRCEIWKVLASEEPAAARQWLTAELERLGSGAGRRAEPSQTRFADFAVSVLEAKLADKSIRSAAGRHKWAGILVHLVEGTRGEKLGRRVRGFGELFVDRITPQHVVEWRTGVAELIRAGDYAPTTANGWLAVLRVLFNEAKWRLGLPSTPLDGVRDFDTTSHVTYTEEEPNALLPEEAPLFLERLRALYPQHYAMVYLGMVTGLRPSSLRPLRRAGATPDVQWDRSRLLVRQSQTRGDEVMQSTKQGTRYAIDLPEEVMEVLRWHVETQLVTPAQRASELLFPSVSGRFRAPNLLNKPLAHVARELGLGKRLTQRGLRRTFNDLARAAQVSDLVTRSISGHATERMQQHYSTVSGGEQRDALGKVVQLSARRALAKAAGG